MKNNFLFLSEWLPTLLTASILSALGSGVIQMILKFILPDSYRAQCFVEYVILTAIICAALAAVSMRLGSKLNRGSTSLSTGVPVFNMLVCGVVYVVLFVALKGRALAIIHLFPCEMFLANGVLGADRAASASVVEKAGFCFLQIAIYIAVSLVFYLVAKKKQEGSEETKSIRGDKKKPNNRFGIDIDI